MKFAALQALAHAALLQFCFTLQVVAQEIESLTGSTTSSSSWSSSSPSGSQIISFPAEQSNATSTHESTGYGADTPPIDLIPPTDAMNNLCPPKYVDHATDANRAVPTNNWWGNLIAFDKSNPVVQPIWSNPYMLQAIVDQSPFGLSTTYQYQYRFSGGNSGNGNAVKYYAHGLVREVVLTASEFASAKPTFKVTDWADQGVTVQFQSAVGSMQLDLVTGMVYTTAKYSGGLSPRVEMSSAITSVNGQSAGAGATGSRFEIATNAGTTWILYSLASDGHSEKQVTLRGDGGSALKTDGAFEGIFRLALAINPSWMPTLDKYKSCIVQGGSVSFTDDSSYAFNWKTLGDCAMGLLHFAMPHHVSTLDTTSGTTKVDGMTAFSTTRGIFQAYTTAPGAPTVWNLRETQEIPSDFYPARKLDAATVQQQRIVEHLREDINDQWEIPLGGSYYFSGKAAQKYASLCLIANDVAVMGDDKSLLATCLGKLRAVMAPYVSNAWTFKLQYDRVYGGIVSSEGFAKNDVNADFGNTMYNDHHFHYGYWVHTAALINLLDPSWAELGRLNAMTDLLIRDVANADVSDKFFPRFRSFDWFRGHSYSHGVTPLADGKDQESTSEDINFSFGMYMYGQVTKNAPLAAVGKLMARLNAHTIQTYFLVEDANQVHPANFRPNKVTGIFFDNKVDYATWFSADKFCIHGIQMLPVSAVTPFVRSAQFVREEWDQVLSKQPIVAGEDVGNPWLSILYANYAAVDKSKAMSVLQRAKMDDGLSRAWAIYMAASNDN